MARTVLVGRAGSPGVGIGRLLVVGPPSASGTDDPVDRNGRGSSDAATEHDRLAKALERCAAELEALAVQTSARAGEEVGAIFEAQALFARDPGIVGPAFTLVASGLLADDAILRATSEQADVLAAVDDDYFRERAADVRDVGRRVAALLSGAVRPDLWHADGSRAVLVAADLDPSAVATLRPELVAGIALGGGAPTGHAAIVARALGIPLVLGLGSSLTVVAEEASVVGGAGVTGNGSINGAVDGSEGRLLIHPSAAELAELELAAASAERSASFGRAASGRPDPSGSPEASGSTGAWPASPNGVSIVANVGSALEAEAAARAGAEGIGLVRTELLFLGRSTPPSVGEQRAAYGRILEAMGDRPVVFRTLDVGGDKPAEWQSADAESNPALGVRGLRLGLRRPDLLDDQFAALLAAAAGRELRVMLPMVATREELEQARERLDAVAARLAAASHGLPSSVRLGVMIEVPSAAIMADSLAVSADFFSIGTNDLVQYVLAADRTNSELADLASALQPAVLRLIDVVVRAAHRHGRHVAVCGEAAADPAVIPLLVGLGVTELSVGPGSLEAVRSLVAGLDVVACRGVATRALAAGTLAEVQALPVQTV
jgi:phosphoenolpyruvate-protein phosphotransferase